MNRKEQAMVVIIISGTLIICGVILVMDELHEFGLPFPRILPDMSDLSIPGLEHYMYGIILILIFVPVLGYVYYRRKGYSW